MPKRTSGARYQSVTTCKWLAQFPLKTKQHDSTGQSQGHRALPWITTLSNAAHSYKQKLVSQNMCMTLNRSASTALRHHVYHSNTLLCSRHQATAKTHFMCVCFHRHCKHPSQSQVSDFQNSLDWVYQKILRLQVSVHDSMLMHECLPTQQLKHERLQTQHPVVPVNRLTQFLYCNAYRQSTSPTFSRCFFRARCCLLLSVPINFFKSCWTYSNICKTWTRF